MILVVRLAVLRAVPSFGMKFAKSAGAQMHDG
jgi:hypothetical protein